MTLLKSDHILIFIIFVEKKIKIEAKQSYDLFIDIFFTFIFFFLLLRLLRLLIPSP